MNGSPVAALVRGWVSLYTRGLPGQLRDARRDEVDDDLWCEQEEAATLGRSGRSLGADLVLRLLFGMPSDISWRVACREHAPAAMLLERSPATSTSILGVLAIVAGLCLGIEMILAIPLGDALWTAGGALGLLVAGTVIVGVPAFLAAALGLAWRFQDRISPLGVIGAMLVPMGFVTGTLFMALMVGSAMLMWDLVRIGVITRLLWIAYTAGAIGFVGAELVGLPALLYLYAVSWIAIGVSLIRGVPLPRATSA